MISCHSLHGWTRASEFLSNVDGLPPGDRRTLVGPDSTVTRITDYSQRNQLIFFSNHILFCCSLKGHEK